MSRDRSVIQSVDRALDILECFEEVPDIGVSELARRLGIHKSTVFGLLNTLSRRGYLEKNGENGKYRLGLRAFQIGSLVLNRMDLPSLAEPILQRLVEKHEETVHLVVRDGFHVVYIAKRESPRSMRIVSQVGRRLACHCTGVGKALLAYLPDEEIDALVKQNGLPRYTKNTITDLARLKEELSRIREMGYAIDNEEIEDGLRCVAAPIRNHKGKVIAAMSVAGPSMRMTADRLPEIIESVKEAAAELSRLLGYK